MDNLPDLMSSYKIPVSLPFLSVITNYFRMLRNLCGNNQKNQQIVLKGHLNDKVRPIEKTEKRNGVKEENEKRKQKEKEKTERE